MLLTESVKLRCLLSLVLLSAVLTGCDSDSKAGSSASSTANQDSSSLVSCGLDLLTGGLALPVMLPAAPNVSIIGSSSAAGQGASSSDLSWVGLLRKEYQEQAVSISNLARGGYTTYQALSSQCQVHESRRQPDPDHNIDQALALQADLVLMSFPSNDATLGYAAQESVSNVLLMRDHLAAKGVALMVLSSQPRNDVSATAVSRLKAFDEGLQQALGACFVPVYAGLATVDDKLKPEYNSGDGVHLNNAGHLLVFEAVKVRINSNECVHW